MVRLKNQPKLRTNLDTDFLKLIAVLSMTVDHVGAVFFRSIRCSAGSDAWPSRSSATV